MRPADDPPILQPVERPAPTPAPPRFDPEFEARSALPASSHRLLLPQYYQRLVANPFLALAGLFAWAWFSRFVLIRDDLHLVLALIWCASLVLIVPLLHYHCLDCGRTGWLFRWRRHACRRVVARQRSGQVRRFRGPHPTFQLLIWIYVFLGLGFLGLVAFVLR